MGVITTTNSNYCIIITTCNNNNIKEKIINELLNKKLCACIQTSNIESSYCFENKINHDVEILLRIKTKKEMYSQIEEVIKNMHNYKTPQIISIPILEGSKEYLDWIDQSCYSFSLEKIHKL